MKRISNPEVAQVFNRHPRKMRQKLLKLRQLIFEVASKIDEVGELDETLKWGEPAYLTSQSKSGSLIRIDVKKSDPSRYAMYFHCQTHLVETFRSLFPTTFTYEKNRAIVFNENDRIPVSALRRCIAMALTYHLSKKNNGTFHSRPVGNAGASAKKRGQYRNRPPRPTPA
jgi:uncharacterized protein DUF1801